MNTMIKYMKSEILNKDIKLDTHSGTVTVKDEKLFGRRGWVEYSADECQIIRETTGEIDPAVHLLKNVFGGEIVRKEVK